MIRSSARMRCPDGRCRWVITKRTLEEAAEAVAKHLACDARHTGGSWVDTDGRERVGLEYAPASGTG